MIHARVGSKIKTKRNESPRASEHSRRERLLFWLSGESVWLIVFTWRRRCEFKDGDRRATISGGMRKQALR
jgi:hypothetical protein